MKRLITTLKFFPVIALATIGLNIATGYVFHLFGVQLPAQQAVEVVYQGGIAAWKAFRESGLTAVFSDRLALSFLLNIPAVLLIAPLLEETVFRFLLWRLPCRFAARRGVSTFKVTLSIAIVASAAFSSAHYITMPWPDTAFAALFFFGLAQCWLYRRTDRLWCPMLNHALFNLFSLVMLFVFPETGGCNP